MDITKFNSLILIIYIYITSISLLFAPFISTFLVELVLLLLLILVTLILNKFEFNLKIIVYFVFTTLFIGINILAVSYKDYVFADGFNFILYSFIPIYLLTQKLVTFEFFRDYWIKLSIIFTYLLPIYYIYRQNGHISYYDIGFLSHLNILIIAYCLISQKSKNVKMIIYLLVNIGVLAILGSRMVLVASLITIIFTFILFSNKKNIKFYLNLILISIIGLIVSQNLLNILIYLNNTIADFGIRSRNLSMFITQLSGRSDDSIILSGRDNIYPVISQYLFENGIRPSGFSVARKLTNGMYYHSHNFFMELLLIFGLLGVILILITVIVKICILLKVKNMKDNKLMLQFLLIFLVSFLIRSLTGTYFVTDVIFLVCLGIFLSISLKEIENT
ncbi:oligosaccharide repeat unit polymerase [Metabacillus idriensis]|uniref:oligosaccharide repeat unit polymerase n=1 Tax=Metabacillus idriensis TaxID=324768 RepID=UPI00174C69D0|nr:oligosaccharide repeat unit polymerase [Metabacillus idriensis]